MNTPRLRIFAGPNGSGKSTLNEIIDKKLLGVYINPDIIEKEIKKTNFLNLLNYNINTPADEIYLFFKNHMIINMATTTNKQELPKFSKDKVDFTDIEVNSYYASICADFIRHELLKSKISFTFETVMSSRDKIKFLQKAQANGYKVYLYFITTQDPIINISRVDNRVKQGGHSVPKDKIVSRYYRSMELLSEAIKFTSRAYIFDNSSQDRLWIAQIDNGKQIEFKNNIVPKWTEDYLVTKTTRIEKNLTEKMKE